MSDDRRNPYFILGIDYGASRDTARKAGARVLRRVRRDTGCAYGIEDVTWALHQVEQAIDNPASGVNHFRVPANPSLFESSDRATVDIPPIPLARRTPPMTGKDLEGIRARALDEALELFIRAAAEHVDVAQLLPARKEESE